MTCTRRKSLPRRLPPQNVTACFFFLLNWVQPSLCSPDYAQLLSPEHKLMLTKYSTPQRKPLLHRNRQQIWQSTVLLLLNFQNVYNNVISHNVFTLFTFLLIYSLFYRRACLFGQKRGWSTSSIPGYILYRDSKTRFHYIVPLSARWITGTGTGTGKDRITKWHTRWFIIAAVYPPIFWEKPGVICVRGHWSKACLPLQRKERSHVYRQQQVDLVINIPFVSGVWADSSRCTQACRDDV